VFSGLHVGSQCLYARLKVGSHCLEANIQVSALSARWFRRTSIAVRCCFSSRPFFLTPRGPFSWWIPWNGSHPIGYTLLSRILSRYTRESAKLNACLCESERMLCTLFPSSRLSRVGPWTCRDRGQTRFTRFPHPE